MQQADKNKFYFILLMALLPLLFPVALIMLFTAYTTFTGEFIPREYSLLIFIASFPALGALIFGVCRSIRKLLPPKGIQFDSLAERKKCENRLTNLIIAIALNPIICGCVFLLSVWTFNIIHPVLPLVGQDIIAIIITFIITFLVLAASLVFFIINIRRFFAAPKVAPLQTEARF